MPNIFQGITFPNQSISPADDGALHRAMLGDCILSGCSLSASGATLTMGEGYLLLCGRQIRIPSPHSYSIRPGATGFARLVVSIDATAASAEDLFAQVSAELQYAGSVGAFPGLRQQDINATGTVYQAVLCTASIQSGAFGGILSRMPGGDNPWSNIWDIPGATAHNSIARGRDLGGVFTDAQADAVASGRFDDLYLGDYWTAGAIRYYIAHIDYALSAASPAHHLVILPSASLGYGRMNGKNTTTGGYALSALHTSGLTNVRQVAQTVFPGHIQPVQHLLTNAAASGMSNSVAASMVDTVIPCEAMIFGSRQNSKSPKDCGSNTTQLGLLRLRPDFIQIGAAWWLRDVGSTSAFAAIDANGIPVLQNASNIIGIRPVFFVR